MALTQMYEGKNNSPQTALSANITADDSVIPVSDISVFPSAPNLATIGNDDNAEVIRYTGISGSTLINCERGFGGTTKKSWDAETVISRQITKYDFDAIQGNITELNTTKQNTYSADATQWDTTPTPSSTKPVTSDGLKTALDGKQATYASSASAWDTTPTASSTKPVTSSGIKTYVDQKILYFYDQSTSTTSTATTEFCGVSDSRINSDTVLLNCEYTVPSAITSGVKWVSTNGSPNGHFSLQGICTSNTCKVNLVLGQKGN